MQAVRHKDKAVEINQAKSTWSVLSSENEAYKTPPDIATTEVKHELEKAARYTFVGRYKDAHKILTREFVGLGPHKYVEAIDLYESTGEWNNLAKYVPFLQASPITTPPVSGGTIWDLITLKVYCAEIVASGVLREPLRFVKEFSVRLSKRDIANYTGIDVQCLVQCHRIILDGKEMCNWRDIDTVLPPLSEVRRRLLDKKLYSEAQALLSTERRVLQRDGLDPLTPYREFLQATVHLELSNNEATLIKLAQVRLDYAELSIRDKKPGAIAAALHKAEELMQRALKVLSQNEGSAKKDRRASIFSRLQTATTVRYMHEEYPRLFHQSQTLALLIRDDLDLQQKMEINRDLSNSVLAVGCILQYRNHLLTAYNYIESVYEAESDVSHLVERLEEIADQIIHLDEDTLKLAYYRGSFLEQYAKNYNHLSKDKLVGILEHFKKFEDKHPKFELASKCRLIDMRCAQVNHAIGREERASLYFAKVEFWTRHCSERENGQGSDLVDLQKMFTDELSMTPFDASRTWYHFMLWCCYVIIKWTEITAQLAVRPERHLAQLLCLDYNPQIQDDTSWWKYSDTEPMLGDPRAERTIAKTAAGVSLILPHVLMQRTFGGLYPQASQNWNPWFLALQTVVFKAMNPQQKSDLLMLTQMCRIWKLLSHMGEVPSVGKDSYNILLFKECEGLLLLAKKTRRKSHGNSSLLESIMSIVARATIRMVLASSRIDGENKSGSHLSRAVDSLYLASKPFDPNPSTFAPTFEVYVITLALAYAEWGKQRNSETFNASTVLVYFSEADSTYQRYRLGRILSMEAEDMEISNFDVIQALPNSEDYSNLAVTITFRALSKLCPVKVDGLVDLTEEATLSPAKVLIDEATKWTQKVKTRPLERLLRDYVDLPGYVLPCLSRNPEVLLTWETRKDFWRSQQKTPPSAKLSYRIRDFYKHDTIVNTLIPDLGPYLNLYAASRANPKQVRTMMDDWGVSVVVLVYIEVRCLEYDWLVFMYRQSQLFAISPIHTLRLQQVGTYLEATKDKRNAFEQSLNVVDEDHRMLCSLIAPLNGWIREGDSLIICPAPSLYRVPFHLLSYPVEASGEHLPVLRKHSVTYAQSFSLLQICQLSQQSKLHCRPSDVKTGTRRVPYFGNASIRLIVHDIIVKSSESDRNRGICNIHLYGQQREHAQDSTSEISGSTVSDIDFFNLDKVSITALLKVRFSCRPNVLFVTQNELQDAGEKEGEHLKKIAALHISGAGSIISTMRPVLQEHHKRFLEAFRRILFDTITNDIDTPCKIYTGDTQQYVNDEWATVCFVDLAQIVQKTIVSLMEQDDEDNAFSQWGNFVLHGAHKITMLKTACT